MRIVQIVESLDLGSLERLVVNLAIEQRRPRDEPEVYCVCRRGSLAIKLTSPRPILDSQERVGRDGEVFRCYKFRTMRADAEVDSGPTWATDNDPKITPVGRFLRLTRVDEIPQLWNVLKGDMTLVGPRPERPEFVSALNKQVTNYNLRHTIRPGITGWAQIRYRYGSYVEDAKEKLRYDLFYVKNISPGLDLLIFFRIVSFGAEERSEH